ncbi:sensor domain-containing phosphodiesterase [Butyrivibrio sp. AE2032]|uniref:sensor domain-containing phosphodiesterase n=1 Tax=Butyrivibrio sp. AE2032 TaxID=1458463 RepID=UPI00068AF5EF|nr:EAL domain-containing protein [Butyrivibrio sp. AE2032]
MEKRFFDAGISGIIPIGLPGGFFIYEAGGHENVLYAGPNVLAMYGCENMGEFIVHTGGTFQGMVHPEDFNRIQNQIQSQTLFGEKKHDYIRYRIITKNGDVRYVEDFGHLLHREDGKSFFYVYIVDVDKNEYFNKNRNSFAEAEILTSTAETDELTGLLNMSFFYQKASILLGSHESWREDISFVHFDIPNFKLFNERNGFKLGDELLCDLANAILSEFNVGSIISRFSDDHFVVCTVGNKNDVVNKVVDVQKKMLLADDVNKKVRVKAGIYYMDDRRSEIGLACDHARLACNSIKNRHDINYCIYDEMLRDNLRRQQYVIDHIDEAIEKEYIKVYYQPVVRVKTGEICGYEALVRWIDPNYGMLSPGDFIDTLEQYHLIHLVDTYVIRKVCQDYARMSEEGKEIVPVSLNISRLDFELCDIFGIVEATREKYGVPKNMLDLEITESALNSNAGFIKSECSRMRDLGYHIWIDDFGSGYSSLNTIAEYSFDVLKLDMVFLRSLDNNPKTGKIMTYIVEGAKAMGVSPLCEGCETEQHFQFLKDIGCERAQGYYFGKPMPMEESRSMTLAKGFKWEKV